MDVSEAVNLLQPALPAPSAGMLWADLGAGTGLFTRALASLLGPEATVFAIDQDANALTALHEHQASVPNAARMQTIVGDMQDRTVLNGATDQPLDGVLFANSLHFIEEPGLLLEDVALRLRTSGRIIIIEYDRSAPSRWVPYPISKTRLSRLAPQLPLVAQRFVSTHPSAFGGQIYCAVLDKKATA